MQAATSTVVAVSEGQGGSPPPHVAFMTPGGRVVVVVVVVVPEEGLGVVLPLLLAATTHRNPLTDFLHSYLTVFTVRIVPTLTHFVSRISGLMFMITCAVAGFVETDSSITAKGDIDVNNEDPTIAPRHSTHMLEIISSLSSYSHFPIW